MVRLHASPVPQAEGKVPEGPPGDPRVRGSPGPGSLETAGGHQGKTLDPLRPRQLLALSRGHQRESGMNMRFEQARS